MKGIKKMTLFGSIVFLLAVCPREICAKPFQTAVSEERTGRKEEAGDSLEEYLQMARICESLITGEAPENIPDGRMIVSSQKENAARVASIASQADDGEWHTFYVIGKNLIPNGKVIAQRYGDQAVYSNLLEEKIQDGDDWYYVARMGIGKAFSPGHCSHIWVREGEKGAGCLTKGSVRYVCQSCGTEREIAAAPMGHGDEDGDSICDRCCRRAIPQSLGSRIQTSLNQTGLTFTCIDEDYEGGMLYLADTPVALEQFGGYGPAAYGDSIVYRYFRDGFQNGFSIKSGLMGIRTKETAAAAYAMSLSMEEYERYRARITGGNFLLRDSQEGFVWGVDEEGTYVLQDPENTSYGIRIAVVLQKPEPGVPERIHWNLNDLQVVELDGREYLFRCIDQDYSDGQQNHGRLALFLCESVIPADYGSDYRLEEQEDGSHQYVFRPGPIAKFGEQNDYKYSDIRNWLDSQEIFNTEPVQIGSDYAYMGSSPEGAWSDFDTNALKPYYIGNQQLNARLFILSVDEAVKYKEYLWKFEGADRENPETQETDTSKGYWLRSPMGNSEEFQTGYAYVVDLIHGNLHPASVKAEGGAGEPEQAQTTVYGIRPAFVMPQD